MLTNYYCTACNAIPSTEKEVFFGCSKCGNKLFKMKNQSIKPHHISTGRQMPATTNFSKSSTDDQLTSISMQDKGIFQIDVEKLIKEEEKSGIVTVKDKNGVIHLNL